MSAPRPCAFVRQLEQLGTSLTSRAGHPCRSSLTQYVNADLLSSYIVPINFSTETCPLLVVAIDDIIVCSLINTLHAVP